MGRGVLSNQAERRKGGDGLDVHEQAAMYRSQ